MNSHIQFEIPENCTMSHFVIKGRFPTLNEYLAEEGKHPKAGGRIKRQYMEMAAWEIRLQLKRFHTDRKVILHYYFFEKDMRRDKDNVFAFASKSIQDALQTCKVINNDGWQNVENFTHDFFVDPMNPRIEVWIEEVEQ